MKKTGKEGTAMRRARFGYLVFLLAAAAFLIFYWDHIALLVFILVLVLPLLLFLFVAAAAPSVRVHLPGSSAVTGKGQAAAVRIVAENRSILPITQAKLVLTLVHRFSGERTREALLFPIGARNTAELTLRIGSQNCGVAEVRLHRLVLYDALGVTSWTKRLRLRGEVAVLPDVFQIESGSGAAVTEDLESSRYHPDRRGGDASQVFDYHEYRDGDKWKDIHWKLSNKLDRLMVKEFSLPVSSRVYLALELNGKGGALDAALEGCASVSAWLFEQGAAHRILWFSLDDGVQELALEHPEDLFAALERVYHCVPYETTALLDALAADPERKPANLIYLAAGLPEGAAEKLLRLSDRTRLSVCAAGELSSDATALEPSGVPFTPLGPSGAGMPGFSL